MEDEMKDQIREWLEKGEVDIFIGYKTLDGHPIPHFFSKENTKDLDDLVTGPARYSLEKLALKLVAKNPDLKIGMLGRDCAKRALNVLYLWNQLNPDNVKVIPLNCCPSGLTDQPNCSLLKPEKAGEIKKETGIDNTMDMDGAREFGQEERFSRWTYEFEKCIKCYGCRDACPVCFCKECSLEHPGLVKTAGLPVEVPIFHLVRAVHMAGRCVDCGLCEEACPVDIPRTTLPGHRQITQSLAHTGATCTHNPLRT